MTPQWQTEPVGAVPPLPPRDPGMRLSLLLGFHAVLCLRSGPGPENHRPPGGSERRLEAACWRALAVVDDRAGDLDQVMRDLEAGRARAEEGAAQSRARRANLEEALGVIPPAVEGQVVQRVCPDCESPFHGPPCPRVRSLP